MSDRLDWALDGDMDGLVKLVLVYVVRWMNRDSVFYHSYRTIAQKLGLSPRFVIAALHELSGQTKAKRTELTLITDPAERLTLLQQSNGRHNCRASIYRVNYANGTSDGAYDAPSDSAQHAPSKRRHNGARHASSKLSTGAHHAPSDGAPDAPMMVHTVHFDGARGAPEVSNEVKKPEAYDGTTAVAAAPPPPLPDGRSGGASSPGTQKAPPVNGTTKAGSGPVNAFRPPGQPDDPFADGGETKAWLSRTIGRTVHLATLDGEQLQAEVPEPDDTVGAKATAGLVHALGSSLRNFALAGVRPQRTVDQQIEAIRNPIQAQEPQRTPAQQIAELLGITLAEAEAKLKPMVGDGHGMTSKQQLEAVTARGDGEQHSVH